MAALTIASSSICNCSCNWKGQLLPIFSNIKVNARPFPFTSRSPRIVSRVSHISSPSVIDKEEEDDEGWAEFGEKVSGEWDGFGADFTVEGKPIELPECVVPEAYREWDVKVFDWQTQCPTLASGSSCLIYRTVKLLPTVGCEADAATVYSTQDWDIGVARCFAYHPSTGCYVALWGMELEQCLVDPRDSKSRIRVIQVLDLELKLKSVRVYVEQWYGPFRNGDQLGGCSIRDSAFAATKAVEASEIWGGVWEPQMSAVAKFPDSQPQKQKQKMEMVVGQGGKMCREDVEVEMEVLLPKQVWCSVRKDESNGGSWCQVGWLRDQLVITSSCLFLSPDHLHLAEVVISTQTATTVSV